MKARAKKMWAVVDAKGWIDSGNMHEKKSHAGGLVFEGDRLARIVLVEIVKGESLLKLPNRSLQYLMDLLESDIGKCQAVLARKETLRGAHLEAHNTLVKAGEIYAVLQRAKRKIL